MIVDLPEPDEPTSAVTVPGFDSKRDSVQHRLVRLIGEAHIVEAHVAANLAERLTVRSGSANSSRSPRISIVRSRPATASVSCVPMFTIWKTGAIMNASSIVYCK